MRTLATLLTLTLFASAAYCEAVVLKRTLEQDAAAGDEVLTNGGFERVEDGRAVGASGWEAGYEIEETVARSGERSVRCSSDDPEAEHGVYFEVQLDQQRPAPVVASGWSRAEDVSGAGASGYSLWVDIEFADGSHSWGNHLNFAAGTHDWQQRTLPIAPAKPIAWIRIFGLFRGVTDTAWFEDYSLTTLELGEGASSFNGIPVVAERATLDAPEPIALSMGDLQVNVDPATGAFVGEDGAASGIFWRDAAARSDFRQPRAAVEMDGDDLLLRAEDDELRLALDARITPRGDHVEVSGEVRDLTGEDRAISVYVALPFDAMGGLWHDDMSITRGIEEPVTSTNVLSAGTGPTGHASRYPLACVTTGDRGAALAVPMDQPRAMEFAYDGASRELCCATHLGLVPETGSTATFGVAIYPVDPQWGFRDALRRYYALYPDCFTKRNRREGIWMPFTDVSTVQGWEDFGFAFHEGDNNVPFDDEADIASFVYCEPTGYWMRMAPEEPRTRENSLRLLRETAEDGNLLSQVTLNSAVEDAQGEFVFECIDAPWCDGARFILNPSPNLYADDERVSRGEQVSAQMWRAFDREEGLADWRPWEGGFELAEGEGRDGSAALRLTADEPGSFGASQHVAVGQDEAHDLTVSGWGKIVEALSAPEAAQWQIFVDITYTDGDHLWGQVARFDPAVEGWQQAETTIEVPKPVQGATVYTMLRGETTGSVLFDELFVGEVGGENLLRNADFEPTEGGTLDGIYIDSSEMAATQTNYRREHWAYAQTPLTFDRDGRVCQLMVFNTAEFARGLAEPLHDRGELLFANSTPNRFPWLAAWLDIMGTETNWSPLEDYQPMSAAELNYRRAICYQRPYLFLQNTVYDDFKPEWVELYFKRAIAWGHFPGFFSHNAADDPYWQRPNLYNRDRPLFQKYIPVCATLSRAGWEPVTYARAAQEYVHLERFGPGEDGAVYLTVFNDSEQPLRARVQVDADRLTCGAAAELLPGGPEVSAQEQAGLFEVELAAQDLAVLKLTERR